MKYAGDCGASLRAVSASTCIVSFTGNIISWFALATTPLAMVCSWYAQRVQPLYGLRDRNPWIGISVEKEQGDLSFQNRRDRVIIHSSYVTPDHY
jgi:hypothetical protein